MNNTTVVLKIKERLQKLSSNDYDNIQCWQFVEAFNKGMTEWCRRNLLGTNQTRTGDEGSKRRIDDLQVLLTDDRNITLIDRGTYVEVGTSLPTNYFEWKRIDADAKTDCCNSRPLVIYLAEEGNVPELLRDYNKKPNFEWGETFCTIKDNVIRIYTNGEFEVEPPTLTYYRQPRRIEIAGCVDPYTLVASPVDIECEFKDDLVELFCDEASKIIAGDTENISQIQRNTLSIEQNN
jgi:hypothetical protein